MPPLDTTLPLREDCPIAARYLSRPPAAVLRMHVHPSFARVELREADDGSCAVILVTPKGRVLAMRYADAADGGEAWGEAVEHYAKWAA